jgi:D-alanine transaminase
MNSYAYYNGKFGRREEISIPLSDRSIFFGDAIYDAAIGSYDRILWEEEHIDRFLANADKIGIKHHFNKKYLSQLLREVGIKSMLKSYFIYFQLSRDLPVRCHSANGCNANLLITIDPIEIKKHSKPLKLMTTDDLRYGYCDIKTVNLLPAVLSATRAEKNGFDEAIFIKDNIVTECTKSNISIINQGRVITHPKNNKILPGIAREHLLITCQRLSVPFEEKEYTVDEMLNAEEILVTSTTKLCQRVSCINRIEVGGKSPDLTDKICNYMFKEYADFCLK